jgi:hypothetical protein
MGFPRYINLWVSGGGRLGIDWDIRALSPAIVVEGAKSLNVKRLGGGSDGHSTCRTKPCAPLVEFVFDIEMSEGVELDIIFESSYA